MSLASESEGSDRPYARGSLVVHGVEAIQHCRCYSGAWMQKTGLGPTGKRGKEEIKSWHEVELVIENSVRYGQVLVMIWRGDTF